MRETCINCILNGSTTRLTAHGTNVRLTANGQLDKGTEIADRAVVDAGAVVGVE